MHHGVLSGAAREEGGGSMIKGIEFLSIEATLPVILVVAPLALGLSFWAWKRSAYRPAILGLELLRLLLIAGVLFALSQPERVETEISNELPKIAVLWDDSASMKTRDVVPLGATGAAPETRADWLEGNFDLAGLELALAGRYRVSGAPLSDSSLLEPERGALDGGAEGEIPATNMASPMRRLLEDPELRALVLLGDGDWNSGGSPADVAMKYRMQGVPIFTTAIGSRTALEDIEFLPLEPPAFALVDKQLSIPYAIRSSMDRDLRVSVSLVGTDGQKTGEVVLLKARSIFEGTLSITPTAMGSLTLTASLPVQSGELDETNNQVTVEIDVREESLRVLLIESTPRWEYRYLRNAMVRDPGVEVDCFLYHPDLKDIGGGPHYLSAFPSREELVEYDVVFLGDVGMAPDQLSPEQCKMIRGLVAEQASGLILMPGLGGRQMSLFESELEPLLPVELDPGAPYGHGQETPAHLLLTEVGRKSSLTKLAPDERMNADLWENLPGFQWSAAALRPRAGATVLAVHSSRDDGYGRLPLLATKNFGTGKVLFMGTDSAWRWREGVEDKIHYRFWRQVVRWMAYQRKMNAGESMRLFYTPERPTVRSLTTFFANVMDAAGSPLEGADLSARIESPAGRISRLQFDSDEGEWGLYSTTFRAVEPGDHIITLTCRDTEEQLVSTVNFVGAVLERVGQPARHDVMAEISRISRGEVFRFSDIERLGERLRALEDPPVVSRRTRLWSHPILGAIMVLLMAFFWIGRKMVGRF